MCEQLLLIFEILIMHKIGNIAIIVNFVFPYICSFLCYLHHVLLLNVN